MKQQDINKNENRAISDDKKIPEQRTGIHSPDTKDAADNNIQESDYGKRSYAYPDFFKKKPKL